MPSWKWSAAGSRRKSTARTNSSCSSPQSVPPGRWFRRHRYDLPPEFFRLFLGESLAYSCAIFSRGATTLEEAQRAKLDLVCTKLNLQAGQRVLDVGCGSWVVYAAKEYDVHVTGITLSEPQARIARQRAEQAGVGDKVDIRVQDYREISGERFDA